MKYHRQSPIKLLDLPLFIELQNFLPSYKIPILRHNDSIHTGHSILDAFAKQGNAIVSFIICVCPHGKTRIHLDGCSMNVIFHDLSKFCRDKLLLKSDKNNGYLYEDLCTFMIISG
jgi:hypothetical protein